MKRFLWILAGPVLAGAQVASTELSAPTLGYVFDAEAHSLRVIEGVPGAATVGRTLHLGMAFERIDVAPNRRFAVGSTATSDTLYSLNLDGTVGVAQASEMPKGAGYFSPSGSMLAIALSERVEIWELTAQAMRKLREFSSAGLKVDRIAISDDGGVAIARSGDNLYRLASGEPELLTSGIREMEFLRSSQDLVVLDGAHQTLAVWRKADAATSEEWATELIGVSSFALSRDEQSAAVLTEDSVLWIETRSGNISRMGLDNAARRIARADGNAVFQLAGDDSSWLLDADSETPRLLALNRGNQ
jgi:hypothetical protein